MRLWSGQRSWLPNEILPKNCFEFLCICVKILKSKNGRTVFLPVFQYKEIYRKMRLIYGWNDAYDAAVRRDEEAV